MTTPYILKISSQGQLTLPKQVLGKLHVQKGSRIAVVVTEDGSLRVSKTLPIQKHFGTLPNAWTEKGQDAATYTRILRNSMQPKFNK